MKHMARLWSFTVRLETQAEEGGVDLVQETRIEKRRGRTDN
jgi:spore cortex formation protein SpoVR/YcgB (stage V sporulation)